ncbi:MULTISPECIES: hypothetical protein [Pseudomonas]|uniref:Uncharacterized protein n=1 Tax=Pseudomonas aphyarum TaxID=2942629 RepID=A0ABT5PWN7_9PSED|nr:hypothetical protein [Pseudomonas aphyarum]MDD1128194.1 hypothetical protein [Pseudomonas aphyarum]
MGRCWPADSDQLAYRGDTSVQLQRLRPDHRRTR